MNSNGTDTFQGVSGVGPVAAPDFRKLTLEFERQWWFRYETRMSVVDYFEGGYRAALAAEGKRP